jgi:hypothetical protein
MKAAGDFRILASYMQELNGSQYVNGNLHSPVKREAATANLRCEELVQ